MLNSELVCTSIILNASHSLDEQTKAFIMSDATGEYTNTSPIGGMGQDFKLESTPSQGTISNVLKKRMQYDGILLIY